MYQHHTINRALRMGKGFLFIGDIMGRILLSCDKQRGTLMKTEDLLSATVEEYLETIYNMSMEDEVVIGARLAEKFRVAPPTVTETLKRLVRDGYVEMDNRRQVTLTETGNQAA